MTGDQVLAVVAALLLGILFAIGGVGYVNNSRRKGYVAATSDALARVAALNEQNTQFQTRLGPIRHSVSRHVDSKAKFDRTDGQQLLLSAIAESEDELLRQVNMRLAAQHDYEGYERDYENLRQWLGSSGHPKLEDATYRQIEHKQFARMKLRAPEACARVLVTVSYRSPAGRNSYAKNAQADFDDLCGLLSELESMRRQQSTTMYLRNQERQKVTAGLRYQVLQRDQYRCRSCGASADDGVVLHVDHKRPVSKGGRSTLDNLQTLCQDCNLGKSDRH